MLSVASDVGGTFTDLVSLNEKTGELVISKSNTTPQNHAKGVLDSIKKAGISPEEFKMFVHGSTIIINTLTERKGVKTGLITTAGFRDVLEIGRANRPDLYNMCYTKPTAFVARRDVKEVKERVTYRGEVLEELDLESVKVAIKELAEAKVESIGVCLLHSYIYPEHEEKIGELIKEIAPKVSYTLSKDLTQEFREYERSNTCVLNCYVQPIAKKYLTTLEEELKNVGMPKNIGKIMQSNGGTFTFELGRQKPINCIESGPVAGVIASALIGKIIGEPNIISLDIGGTTVKCSLIESNQAKITTDYKLGHDPKIAKFPVKVPTIDIIEIGSGGGSIAWLDECNSLHIGPRSMGAYPGPACYGLGGKNATTTDANVLTRRINPDYFFGGSSTCYPEKSKEAIDKLTEQFNLSNQKEEEKEQEAMDTEQMALGILRLADANMVTAIKIVSVRRGYDPSEFTVLAFGGGGPTHAASLLRSLKVKKIIVPTNPGVFSAFGMLLADLRRDYIKTNIVRTDLVSSKKIHGIYQKMEEECLTELKNTEEFDESNLILKRTADMRYFGQEHTVTINVPNGVIDDECRKEIDLRFHRAHEKAYTFSNTKSPIEIVNFKITALIPKSIDLPKLDNTNLSVKKAFKGQRNVYWDEKTCAESKIYDRQLLPSGVTLEGPLVLEENTSTTIVYPGQQVTVDEYGFLHIEEIKKENQLIVKEKILKNHFTLEIIKDSIEAISEEMFYTMQRTSMSTIIYEVLDYAVGLADCKGRLISQGNGVSGFIGMLSSAIDAVLEKYSLEQLHEEDIIIINDPYSGGGSHLSDVCLVYPIFYTINNEKKLIGFSINKAHWTEVGGANAGSWSTDTREIYAEGLQFPCIKLYNKGQANEALIELIEANVRFPKETIGDMNAQIGSIKLGGKRLCELCDKYGLDLVLDAIDKTMEYGEKMTQIELSKLPKDTFFAEGNIDDDGLGNGPFKVCVKVTITESEFICDFTGSCGQAEGPINCSYSALTAAVRCIFKAVTNSTISANDGCFAALKIICPEKTIFSAQKPAPVSTYWETMIFASDLVWKALAPVVPERLTCGHFLSVCGTILAGVHPDTKLPYILVEPQAGGWGSNKNKDGENGVVCIGDGETYIIPIEVCEMRYGCRVKEFCLDICEENYGAGKKRGGRGLKRSYEITSEDCWVTATFGRNKFLPWGASGGIQGSPNYIVVKYLNDRLPQSSFGKCARLHLKKGDIIELYTGTGGGYGNPLERPVEDILEDIKDGYITLKSAERDYGIIIDKETLKFKAFTEKRKK
ncbi:putative 5-oxoprolinase (eurofung)-related [Anaeramoeba flamelloides]|uniref:5-oxoprolinase (Eurofung)-related n=1 Tax=Anaeramoeba flamelloides TaxID=1746091 RepID=A0AAV7ZAX4_9EUKA|nr:putative 5-oxoprolinase (eurofung)-related [Anaeramoeba flamelloides]